jgi:hypothetical protein
MGRGREDLKVLVSPRCNDLDLIKLPLSKKENMIMRRAACSLKGHQISNQLIPSCNVVKQKMEFNDERGEPKPECQHGYTGRNQTQLGGKSLNPPLCLYFK